MVDMNLSQWNLMIAMVNRDASREEVEKHFTFERYQAIKSMREAASKPGTATVSTVGTALGKEIARIVDID